MSKSRKDRLCQRYVYHRLLQRQKQLFWQSKAFLWHCCQQPINFFVHVCWANLNWQFYFMVRSFKYTQSPLYRKSNYLIVKNRCSSILNNLLTYFLNYNLHITIISNAHRKLIPLLRTSIWMMSQNITNGSDRYVFIPSTRAESERCIKHQLSAGRELGGVGGDERVEHHNGANEICRQVMLHCSNRCCLPAISVIRPFLFALTLVIFFFHPGSTPSDGWHLWGCC